MESIETVPQKVVDQKIIILKARLDPNKAKSLGEEKKKEFSRGSRFYKKRSPGNDVALIGFSKYYEPFVIVGGRYSIDYCKKHFFEIKTDTKEDRLFVAGEEKKPEPYDPTKPNRIFKLIGEERCHYEDETFIVLDRLKREVPIEKISMAPFNEETEDAAVVCDLRKVNISVDEEIDIIKSKIVKRPANSDFIIREIFEINDRLLVYTPMYELIFQDHKTSDEIILLVEGTTGRTSISKKLLPKNEELPYSEKLLYKHVQQIHLEKTLDNTPDPPEPEVPIHEATEITNTKDSPIQEKEITNSPRAWSKSEVENALFLAKDLLGRLGYKKKITPLKVTQENDAYVVELGMEDRTAKVLVNTKTKEVKEYDIQRADSF